jgi:hypothetical protein
MRVQHTKCMPRDVRVDHLSVVGVHCRVAGWLGQLNTTTWPENDSNGEHVKVYVL